MNFTTPPTPSRATGTARKGEFKVEPAKGFRIREIFPEGCHRYRVPYNTSPRRRPGEYLFPI
jgi:hypothetical protein